MVLYANAERVGMSIKAIARQQGEHSGVDMLTIEQQIADTDVDAIRSIFTQAPYPCYAYQAAAYRLTGEEIRRQDPDPFIIGASVSAGKTDMIAMICTRIAQMNSQQVANNREPYQTLVISRQAEIVSQDSDQLWKYGVQNSIFCAGLSRKAAAFPVIVGSEGTVVNSLEDSLRKDKCINVSLEKISCVKAYASGRSLFEQSAKAVKKAELKDYTPFFVLIDECHMMNVTDYCESELAGESFRQMIASKRASYTIIIRTLEKRCMEKYGKRLRVIGYTGSPWRDNQQIVNENLKTPGFWRKKIIDIDTPFLCSQGAVVPYRFGDTSGLRYDLSNFHSDGEDGIRDFTASDMQAMEKEILKQGTLTQRIMLDVQKICSDRNGVLVTCAGKKHCEEAAKALIPGTKFIIITDDMGQKARLKAMSEIKAGFYKYVFQIGCLTTGVNVPWWDVGVILRRIGSITLLTQLNGRIIRLLPDGSIEHAVPKNDALILDYSGTMDDLGQVFFDPQIEQYQYEQAEINEDYQICPECDGHNSPYARRCINKNEFGNRCDYWFKFRECEDIFDNAGRLIKEGCGAKNDPCARFCQQCAGMLIDPNDKLSGTHYTEGDYYNVLEFDIKLTKDQRALVFYYWLDDRSGGKFHASELFMPESELMWARNAWKVNGVSKHIANPKVRSEVRGIKSALRIMNYAPLFMKPLRVTHRKNGKGKDIIANKVFVESK